MLQPKPLSFSTKLSKNLHVLIIWVLLRSLAVLPAMAISVIAEMRASWSTVLGWPAVGLI